MLGDITAADEIYIVTGLFSRYFYPHLFVLKHQGYGQFQKDGDKNILRISQFILKLR